MDRRKFIKSVSAASTAAYCSPGLTMGTAPSISKPAVIPLMRDISTSINASFGDGFQVQDVFHGNSMTWANISNRENHYLVSSHDQLSWEIVSTTSI